MTRFSALVLTQLLLTCPVLAQHAPQDPPTLADSLSGSAREDYESGRLLYETGDYSGAALKFESAHRASNDPRLLWNIAAAERNLRNYARVESLLQRYVGSTDPRVTDSDRAEAQVILQTVSAFIGSVTVFVDQSGAAIHVDGTEFGTSPLPTPLRLNMGPHTISVLKPGFRQLDRRIEVTGGANALLDLMLQPIAHEGTLRIVAPRQAAIRVDGQLVGHGEWEGKLPSGTHDVEVSAPGKQTLTSSALVRDDERSILHATLLDRPTPMLTPSLDRSSKSGGATAWPWLALGALVLGGLGTGAYFLLKPDEQRGSPIVEGTYDTIELPLRFH